MKKLNDLDLKILRRLTNNARVPLRDVAEGENSSRSSVNQRLTRMLESGVLTSLKYHVNPKKIGYNTCIKLYAIDNNDLMRILNGIIQSIPGVIATETLISLDVSFERSIHIPDHLPQ